VYNSKKSKWFSKLKIKKYNKNEMYKKELEHFFKCIKERTRAINDITDGRYTLKIALAIIKSSKLKKIITIN
jgi:predicted dehydrogenase